MNIAASPLNNPSQPIPRPMHGFSLNVESLLHVPPVFGFQNQDSMNVEWMYRLYKRMPKKAGRLNRSKEAALRALTRRSTRYLPKRAAFESTVDYFEAYLPLFRAKEHFLVSAHLDECTRSLIGVCKDILPKEIF